MINRFEQPVRVLFHLNEGYTKVYLERTPGGLVDLDILTENIPSHLRNIGSRFILIFEVINSEFEIVEYRDFEVETLD